MPLERSIMNQTGHRSVQMGRRYIRDGSLCFSTIVVQSWGCNGDPASWNIRGAASSILNSVRFRHHKVNVHGWINNARKGEAILLPRPFFVPAGATWVAGSRSSTKLSYGSSCTPRGHSITPALWRTSDRSLMLAVPLVCSVLSRRHRQAKVPDYND